MESIGQFFLYLAFSLTGILVGMVLESVMQRHERERELSKLYRQIEMLRKIAYGK